MPAAVTAAVVAPPPTPAELVAQWEGLAHQRASTLLSQNGWLGRCSQDVEDVHEEAVHSLRVAATTWTVERNVKFGYYAQLCIDRHLWDYAAKEMKRRGASLASDIGGEGAGDVLDSFPSDVTPEPSARLEHLEGGGGELTPDQAKMREWLLSRGFTERAVAVAYLMGARRMSAEVIAEVMGGGLTAEAVRALAGDVVVSVRRVVWGEGGGGAAGEGPGLFDGVQ
jgi:hypothetical protein